MAVKTYITLIAGVTRCLGIAPARAYFWWTALTPLLVLSGTCSQQRVAFSQLPRLSVFMPHLKCSAQNHCHLSCHVHSNQMGVFRDGQVGHIADTGDHSCSRLDDAP